MKHSIFALTFSILLGFGANLSQADSVKKAGPFASNVNMKTGAISVPGNYRLWPTLGTWSHASTEGAPGAKEYHIVYTQPETIAYYRNHGKYPDGAVLVKELIHTETMSMTTGPAVSHATKVKGWFVLVRDTQERFKDSPLWGDGWGWSLFNAGDRVRTVSKDYKEDCLACHLPARSMAPESTEDADKWIYTFGYPVLKDK